MSRRLRGEEISVRVSIDGETQNSGSWLNITEFSVTERADINEISYLGEKSDDLDYQHHGFDFSMKVDVQDDKTIRFMEELIRREYNAETHPDIVLTVLYQFRNGTRLLEAYHGVYLRSNEKGFGSRKDAVTASFEGKAREMKVISQ